VDWLLLQGLQQDLASETAVEATAAMTARLANLPRHGNFSEYWNPMNGSVHGTGSFSWTAALYLDTFCSD
jgi:hypothetical protein